MTEVFCSAVGGGGAGPGLAQVTELAGVGSGAGGSAAVAPLTGCEGDGPHDLLSGELLGSSPRAPVPKPAVLPSGFLIPTEEPRRSVSQGMH